MTWYERMRRIFDCAVAMIILVVTSPIILLAIILVRRTSSGAAIYTQLRVGREGREFWIYKIRTMYHNCEKDTGATWCKPGDTRITPIGRILRKLHIDELPQLWNVLRGDMSLVGPRPERPEFVGSLMVALPDYYERLHVSPGITGLAQIQLPPDTDVESVKRKLVCDRFYVHNLGLVLDAKILLGTSFYICRAPFAWSKRIFGIPTLEVIQHRQYVQPRPSLTDTVVEAATVSAPPTTQPQVQPA